MDIVISGVVVLILAGFLCLGTSMYKYLHGSEAFVYYFIFHSTRQIPITHIFGFFQSWLEEAAAAATALCAPELNTTTDMMMAWAHLFLVRI